MRQQVEVPQRGVWSVREGLGGARVSRAEPPGRRPGQDTA